MDRRKNRNLFDDDSEEDNEEYVPSNTVDTAELVTEKKEEPVITQNQE